MKTKLEKTETHTFRTATVHAAQAHRPAEVVLRGGGGARRARQREGQVGQLRPEEVRQDGAEAGEDHQHGQLRKDLQHGEAMREG